jgi:hypothetical protein
MEGAILDVGSDGTNVPTDEMGDYPPAERHRIRSVTDSGTLVLYTTASTVTGKKYRISDLVDLHPTMHQAFDRGCEYYYTIRSRDQKNQQQAEYNYRNAVLEAMQAMAVYGGERGPSQDFVSVSVDEPSSEFDFGDES